jgi:hypothetical protein
MDSVFYYVGAPLLAACPILIGIAALLIYKWRERSRNRRNPLTRSLLNPPGASLRARLKEDEDDLMTYVTMTLAFSFYIAGVIAGQRAPGIQSSGFWLLAGALSLAVIAFFLYRTLRLFSRVRRRRLGLDGEMATAEELNQLMRHGYYVYHDIPGQNYNVDHVVVGKNGVFAFETKTHAKPAAGFKAVFDGRSIKYPDQQDSKAVQQAERNALTLAKYLSRASGARVRVQPVVVLPGWYLETTARPDGVVVLSSGQLRGWLPKFSKDSLAPQEISAIVHQLDQLCRCGEPLALSNSDVSKFERKLAI